MGGISISFLCLSEEEQAAASQGELSQEAMKRKEEDVEGKDAKRVYTKNFFIGLEIEKRSSECCKWLTRLANVRRRRTRKSCPQSVLPVQAVLRSLPILGQV